MKDILQSDTWPESIFLHHRAGSDRSGISPATAIAAGIHSEANVAKITSILGWRKYPRESSHGIVFPYTDLDGRNGYTRFKPDTPRIIGGKPVKYESPKGQPNKIYFPPGVVPCLSDTGQELIITEGEKKPSVRIRTVFLASD